MNRALGKRRPSLMTALCVVIVLAGIFWIALDRQSGWEGTDTIVEELADRLAGVKAREPFINTDRGDLLLFVFAVGGFGAGFTMGYLWRDVFKSA